MIKAAQAMALFWLLDAICGCASGPRIDATMPPPRIVTVDRVVTSPCLNPGQAPPAPPPVGASLNGDARHDVTLLAASLLAMRAWQGEVQALLTGCAAPISPAPPDSPAR